tara:strand:+ start:10900 stop:11232 length:333 start_codon:yes stop_codon:yes gene_type:complete
MDNKPALIEPGISYLLKSSLKEYHRVRENNTSFIFNIVTGASFFLLIALVLLWRYKGRLTKSEIYKRNIIKKEYIMSKLQQYSGIKKQSSLITDLPTWNEHPEFNILSKR